MAPRGRKRKAEAAAVSTSEKREKLENGKEQVEEAVVIEHCTSRVYGRNAAALSQALRLEAPELPVKVNPSKPRRGSFEVPSSGPGLRRDPHANSNSPNLKKWWKS
uniref:Uncharacterized protein n=2 Tax=Marmotini TaxID=337730 RepID=A0A8C6EW01_MARMA